MNNIWMLCNRLPAVFLYPANGYKSVALTSEQRVSLFWSNLTFKPFLLVVFFELLLLLFFLPSVTLLMVALDGCWRGGRGRGVAGPGLFEPGLVLVPVGNRGLWVGVWLWVAFLSRLSGLLTKILTGFLGVLILGGKGKACAVGLGFFLGGIRGGGIRSSFRFPELSLPPCCCLLFPVNRLRNPDIPTRFADPGILILVSSDSLLPSPEISPPSWRSGTGAVGGGGNGFTLWEPEPLTLWAEEPEPLTEPLTLWAGLPEPTWEEINRFYWNEPLADIYLLYPRLPCQISASPKNMFHSYLHICQWGRKPLPTNSNLL